MNFDKPEMLDFLPQNGVSEAPGSLMENLTGAFDAMKYTGGAGANSRGYTLLDVWTPIIDELNETGADFENPAIWLFDSMSSRYDGKADEIYSYIQNNKESLPESLSEINPASVDEMMKSFVQQKESEFAELSRSNPGFFPAAARFVGGMGAGGGDPVTTATMPFGGWSKTLWKNIAQSAAVNAGAGAISELDVKDWYDELGLEYGYEEFLQNVAMQAAFGAAMPAAGAGIRMTANQALKGWDVLKGKMKKPLSAEDQALVDKLESQADIEESNPLQSENGIEAESEHEARLSDATAALAGDTAPRMPDEPSSPIKGTIPLQDELNALDEKWLANNAKLKAAEAEGLKIQDRLNDAFDVDPNLTKDSKIVKDLMDENKLNQSEVDEFRSIQDGLGGQRVKILEAQEQKLALIDNGADNIDGVIYNIDPMDIEVDAKTFQFKEGGDEFGVTERLQGVTTWDKYKSGTVTVYEYADGRMAIADGHQRLGLAKRIRSQDPSQDVRVYAYKLRETDGITPEEARVIAAMKNIAEGTGTSIDAAKVLRVDPSRISELPPRSELVRQARDMMGLSDTAFGAVVNGVIPPRYGAIVGRLIDDQDLQGAAIEVLAKADPSNAFQAESIVRQVRESGSEQVEQISLFGEEVVTESFFVERSKILDRAYKELRRDKAAFETLVRNSERLEAEGNILVKDANERKASTDAQTIALLQTLANRKGPLSDALNDAAKTARNTNSYVAATSGFLDAVRGSIKSGDFDRLSTGDVGRAVDGPPEITRSEATAEPALEGFDEPTGIAAERQADQLITDMFGADEAAPAVQRLDVSPIEEDLVAIEDIKMPIDDSLPPDQIRAQVRALTEENTEIVRGLIQRIDSKFGTESGDNVKDLAKVTQKANRPSILAKKPWHKTSHIRDSYRFKTVIDDFRDVPAIFDELLDSGIRLVKVDTGKLFDPKEWGWRIIAFDLRMPNGQLVEWYLPIRELEAQKKSEGHLLFEEWRNKSPEEIVDQYDDYMATIQRSFEGYDNSFQSGLDRLGISREEAAASWARAESSMLDAARKSPSSSGMTTSSGVRGVETQVPSRVRMTEEPDSVQSMTRDVPSSTSANLGEIIDDTSGANLDITSPDVKSGDIFDDMDLEVPVGQRFNEETGLVESTTMTMRDLKAQLDAEDSMITRLEFCTV